MKEKFDTWFKAQNIKHFSADEFTSYFNRTRNGTRNSYPAQAKWSAILPTLRIVDKLRAHFGRPIVLLSSYRSPAYNKAISGASRSFHCDFIALDIAVAGKSPKQVIDVLRAWRKEGRFTGGLGLYDTFVHIDTRGYNANW
jgi:uncharacterized protein YcbK (DUF882 family)